VCVPSPDPGYWASGPGTAALLSFPSLSCCSYLIGVELTMLQEIFSLRAIYLTPIGLHALDLVVEVFRL
jgi:hypothetical protein